MRGNGTQESPYIITSWSELEELSERYYDHENAYIAFDSDADNKVIDMTENPVTKTIKLYCWHIIGNGWTIRNMRSSVSIFKPEDALRISYVSDLNFEDFFLDGSAGTVYFTNDTAAFSGDWDRGNCKWTGCTFSGILVNSQFTNNHWANDSEIKAIPILDQCTLDLVCEGTSGFSTASDPLIRDTKITMNATTAVSLEMYDSKLKGSYRSLTIKGVTSVVDADVDSLSGDGGTVLVNSDKCSVPDGFVAVTTEQLKDKNYLFDLGYPINPDIKEMPQKSGLTCWFDYKRGVDTENGFWENQLGETKFEIYNPTITDDYISFTGSNESYAKLTYGGSFGGDAANSKQCIRYVLLKNLSGIYSSWRTIIGNETGRWRCSTIAMNKYGYYQFTRNDIYSAVSCSEWHVVCWTSDANTEKSTLWIDGIKIGESQWAEGWAADTYLCRGSTWWYSDNDTAFRTFIVGDELHSDEDIRRNSLFLLGDLAKWQFINGELTNILFPAEKISGAFMNARNLEYAYIPRSCKKIGELAFTNTKLRRVKIANDCEYYPTSFPPGCEIEFYGGGGEYGQLYDSEGYAIIDADGARIYAKE